MKLLLDTNIIVDIISEREGYTESLQLLRYCEVKFVEGWISVISVTDVMYILRNFRRSAQGKIRVNETLREHMSLREHMLTLFTILDVAVVMKSDITGAFTGGMTDYEDAVQAHCAYRIGADYIVTRNLRDFEWSPVPAISPGQALNILSGPQLS
jgi:predicted nucleic acid-binding protein